MTAHDRRYPVAFETWPRADQIIHICDRSPRGRMSELYVLAGAGDVCVDESDDDQKRSEHQLATIMIVLNDIDDNAYPVDFSERDMSQQFKRVANGHYQQDLVARSVTQTERRALATHTETAN